MKLNRLGIIEISHKQILGKLDNVLLLVVTVQI